MSSEISRQQQLTQMELELSRAGISIQQIIDSLGLPQSLINREYDAAWTCESKEKKFRGRVNSTPKEYIQPIGYYGIGLSTSKYENKRCLNSDDSEDTWIVVYHKTKPEFVQPILEQGFKAGTGQSCANNQCIYGKGVVGVGIYFSDVIGVTHPYGANLNINDLQVQIIVQCRVNSKAATNPNKTVFVVANPTEIIPIRILIKKL